MDFAVPQVSLRKHIFPYWFPTQGHAVFGKENVPIGDITKVKLNITIVNFHTFGSLLKLQTCVINITGVRA
jgi:hypothetical protein